MAAVPDSALRIKKPLTLLDSLAACFERSKKQYAAFLKAGDFDALKKVCQSHAGKRPNLSE